MDTDNIKFADANDLAGSGDAWQILIVDDEPDVHAVTELAIGSLTFAGRPIALHHASNTEEAREALSKQQFAVALFDVVMDTEHAGLDLVKYLRDTLGEQQTRVIIRTGQPGTAPEWTTVADYDINGYEDKATATAQRLRTAVFTALRGFDQLQKLEQARATVAQQNKGLHGLVETLRAIAAAPDDRHRTQYLMDGLRDVINAPKEFGAVVVQRRRINAGAHSLDLVTDASGIYQRAAELGLDALSSEINARVRYCMDDKTSRFEADHATIYTSSVRGEPCVVYLSHPAGQRVNDDLLQLFCQSAADVTEAAQLEEQVQAAQSEMVLILSEAVEARSLETGNHVRRVGLYSKVLAKHLGLPEHTCDMLEIAAPLHDVGKVSIPDSVLKKPGGLTDEEWQVMKTHAEIGGRLLREHDHPVMRAAAVVAAEHHEKWDGSGYPRKLAGEDIHIYGRITAVADVFDAISSDRVYKQAWPLDKCKAHIKSLSGTQFDPDVVRAFEACWDELLDIRENMQD